MRRLAILSALLLLGLTSCSEIEPVIPVADRRMVVIPMRDDLHYYYESATGTELARAVTAQLEGASREDSDAVKVVPFEDLIESVRDVDTKDLSFADVGRRAKADLILVGNIVKFDTRQKGDVGFVRGAAKVDLIVLETAHPEKPLYRTTVTATFPPEGYRGWGGYSGTEGDESDVRAGLLALTARRVAELFYPHQPEKD
jgi:hypothetical protein